MIPDNDWYGHKYILSLYCERPRQSAIYGTLMHGWRPEMGGSGHRRLASAPMFVWNEMLAADAARHGIRNTRSIGSPFLYLADLLGQGSEYRPCGRGTLCFPYHSADHVLVEQNHQEFIEHVEATEPAPYTASIFYQDFERPGYREAFEYAGWRVVSFGKRNDPLFLFRLHAEILSHEAVIADQLGTSIWYAGALGRRIRVAPGSPAATRNGKTEPLLDLTATFPSLHAEGLDQRGAQDEAYRQLGHVSMLSPSELATALGWQSSKRFFAAAIGRLIDIRCGPGPRAGRL